MKPYRAPWRRRKPRQDRPITRQMRARQQEFNEAIAPMAQAHESGGMTLGDFLYEAAGVGQQMWRRTHGIEPLATEGKAEGRRP